MRRGSGILTRRVAVVVGVGVLLGTASCGGQAANPRTEIEKAVRSYVSSSGCCQFSGVSVERVTISQLDSAYATAFIDGYARPHTPAGSLTAVLDDAGGSGWVVLGLGTAPATLGCNVPGAVAAELGLACGVPA
jgi:hypothetical protein